MWLLKLSWKNMWRNRNRTAITMTAVFFSVILSILTNSLQEGVFDNLIKNVVSFYSGYIQIHKTGYWDEQILDNTFENSQELQDQILQLENIDAVTPRLESFALASSDTLTKGCMVIGILPGKEDAITQLKNKVTEGNYLSDGDLGIMMGEGLARRLKLELKDSVVLIGQGYHGAMAVGKYPITGILSFGQPEMNDQSLYMTLANAQVLYSAENRLTSYVIGLENTNDLDPTAENIRSSLGDGYETMTWEEMMPEVVQHIRTDKGSMVIIQLVLYMLIAFGIFGTLLMMMVERKYEMGMLVAIGMKKFKLMQVMMLESLFTVLSGCILGILASIPIVVYLYKYPIRFKGQLAEVYEEFGFEAIFPTSTNPEIFLNQGILVLILGLILSLYPIVKIARINPVNAMKK
ncbi:FtsX-like permease family protein [Algoriphagus sp. CAU 1675]|uniref:ABC transporter permease n=1 Tax=Algoriphagus sp. CAU 1675 TaxID=3032597 RepID=UPI0023DA9B1C|nr:FtsX-like permease family protein [Algoriphagus sp. CAU 1675]MDF2157944.1 ABC transporter permease [Algoriphagus sp. CAU 1675]